MVREIYHIKDSELADATESVLLMELGKSHFCYGIITNAGRELYKAGYFVIENGESGSPEKIFSELRLHQPFHSVGISYHHPDNLLIPAKYYDYDNASSILNAMHGRDQDRTIIAESLPEWQLYNVFSIERMTHDFISQRFSSGKYWHAFSVALKTTGQPLGSLMKIDFKTSSFSVILMKDHQLQLAQIFFYTTADDVLYYLLKICTHFSLMQEEVNLVISGLIEKQSGMFEALNKYFLNISFQKAEGNLNRTQAFDEYPAHYFTSLNNLAACVL